MLKDEVLNVEVRSDWERHLARCDRYLRHVRDLAAAAGLPEIDVVTAKYDPPGTVRRGATNLLHLANNHQQVVANYGVVDIRCSKVANPRGVQSGCAPQPRIAKVNLYFILVAQAPISRRSRITLLMQEELQISLWTRNYEVNITLKLF